MQSHASRHVVSEFLKDLHPYLDPPFPKEVIKDEIAVAYGRRGTHKLIAVLSLEELPDDDRAHCLRVFNSLLTTQETKLDAVSDGAVPALLQLVASAQSFEVRRLSCESLASLNQVLQGRQALVEDGGLPVLTGALQTTPEASAGAFRVMASCMDGVILLMSHLELVVPALTYMINNAPTDKSIFTLKACENAAATLAGITTKDEGIIQALESHVPRCIVNLAVRGLAGDFKFENEVMGMLEQCSYCLQQLSHHAMGKTAIREADGIRVLCKMLGLGQPETTKRALSALMGITIEKESKRPTAEAGVGPLARLVRGKDADISANAKAVLINCCEDLKARRQIEMSFTSSELLELLGPLKPTPPDYRYNIALPYNV